MHLMSSLGAEDGMSKTIPLYKIAHARTGDKANRSNISVIVYRPEDFSLLQLVMQEWRWSV